MKTLGYYIGITKQTEVLVLILLGICCTIFDASLFNLHTNLFKVWDFEMESTKFTDTAQTYVKYILSTIVLVRTFTVHLYLAFYVVMLWPAIYENRAGLLLPWLILGSVKCLAMGAITLSTGLYVCLSYRFAKISCLDFLLAQIVDQAPSVYMWFCILSYYRDLKSKVVPKYRVRRASDEFGLAERRRRARSLFADKKLQNTFDDKRQLISVSTIDTIINQLNTSLHRGTSRSLDSLLDLMAAEAEKEEILSIYDEIVEDDDILSVAEKTVKMLKLSKSYIEEAKHRTTASDAYDSEDMDDFKSGKWFSESEDVPLRQQHTVPLLKKSYSEICKKAKTSKRHSDDLSLIPSEAEMRTVGLTDSVGQVIKPVCGKRLNVDAKQKYNVSKLPRRKREESGCQVDTMTGEIMPKPLNIIATNNNFSKKPTQKYTKSPTVKSKSQPIKRKNEVVTTSTFKYDGYTLAYMQKQKKNTTANDKKIKRPNKSYGV